MMASGTAWPHCLRGPRYLAGALLVASILAAASWSSAAPGKSFSDPPFRGGESLKYQLQWLGLPIATVRLSTDGPIKWNGKRVFRYRARLKSIGLLKRLYRVDDHAESYADARNLFSYRFDIRQKEGSYRAHKWNIFERFRTVYGRKKSPPRYYETYGELSDVLSALYKVRSLNLRPGQEKDIHVFQGKYLYRVFFRVTGREKIDTLWGPIQTLVIQPRVVGVSRLNGQVTTWVWVTADRLHVPVRIESRTYVGSFVSHLVESRGIPSGPLARAPTRSLKRWNPKLRRIKEDAKSRAAHLKKLLNRSGKKRSKSTSKNP